MNTKLALALASSAATAALILSCSDDSPGDADAAVCDCPAAEPPLSGRLTTVENRRTSPGPSPAFILAAECPAGALLLGGGCDADPLAGSLVLRLAGIRAPAGETTLYYGCAWTNTNNDSPQFVSAWATCLTPAP